ncbi:MAG: hypothetical protein MRZ79_21655 [Bacteroidia bacterium]|nr:hypothetical protein [Bacteroidia bacterium]
MSQTTRKYVLGKENLLGLSVIGWALLIVSIGAIINIGYLGALLIIPAVLIIISHSGVLLDTQERLIKEYMHFAFIEWGKWETVDIYDDILVLSMLRSFGMESR